MANLELVITAGAEWKEWLANLEKQIDRLERLQEGAKDEAAPAVESDDAEDEDEDEAPAKAKSKPKSKPKKVAEAFDDDEEDEAPAEDDGEDEAGEEDEDEAPTAKANKSKSKKLTPDDCNDAAKTLAKAIGGKPGRDAVLKLMKKQFRTVSVSELKPEQYADFIAAMTEAVEEHEG